MRAHFDAGGRLAWPQDDGDGAAPSFGHGEQHDAAVRSEAAAIEIGRDHLPRNGWKGKAGSYRRSWRAWLARSADGLAQTPKSYAVSRLTPRSPA